MSHYKNFEFINYLLFYTTYDFSIGTQILGSDKSCRHAKINDAGRNQSGRGGHVKTRNLEGNRQIHKIIL
jgi:hypothetical protein